MLGPFLLQVLHGCRALDFLDIAAQSEPRAVLIPFLRFKVHLERKDSPAAMEQLKAMRECDDFAKEHLQVSLGSSWLSFKTL